MIVLALAAVLASLSCSDSKEDPGSLRIGLATELERLSPVSMKNPESFRVAWQIYEGLLGLDAEGRIVPRIAKSWETEDHKTWTFYIREGVRFHQSELFGAPPGTRAVTAHDVLYSYTRFCGPGSYPAFVLADSVKGCSDYGAGRTDSVAGLRVVDERTFRIELKKPEPFFLNRITSPWLCVFPRESAQEEFKDRWGLKLVVGTGPFKLLSKTDNEIILEKNKDYWDASRIPDIQRVTFRVVTNDQIMFTELMNDKLDMMALPNRLFPTVFDKQGRPLETYEKKFGFVETRTFNTHMIGINMERIPDVHLRRAMRRGVNRKEMIQCVLHGRADGIAGPVPPGMNGYLTLLEDPYDPVKAKEELGLSRYGGESIELLMHDQANSELISQLFQKQMKDIGIDIRLSRLDYNSIGGRMVSGQADLFNIFADIVFSSPEPLLLNLFSSTKIPVPNFWRYSNTDVDRKLEELRHVADRQESVIASARIVKEIMADAPAIFLYRQNQVILLDKRFKNLKVNGHNRYMLEELEAAN